MKNILTNIKSNLSKASVNKKLYVFLVCLFLSIFYWLINVLGNQYTSTLKVSVVYKNQAPQYIVLNKLPSHLTLNVVTDGYNLLGYQFNFNKPKVEIDLSNYQFDEYKNINEIRFNDFLPTLSKQLGNKIIINEISPRIIKVILDKKVIKLLKVLPDVKLTFKNQFQLSDSIVVTPNNIYVTGPAIILDTLRFIPSSFIEIKNIEGSISKKIKLNIDFLTSHHLQTKIGSVDIKINTDKFTEYKLSLPSLIKNTPDTLDIDIIPQSIEIKFLIPLKKLADLHADEFELMVDYNELSPIYKKLKVHMVKHPDFVRNITLKPAKVEYVLKRKEK